MCLLRIELRSFGRSHPVYPKSGSTFYGDSVGQPPGGVQRHCIDREHAASCFKLDKNPSSSSLPTPIPMVSLTNPVAVNTISNKIMDIHVLGLDIKAKFRLTYGPSTQYLCSI